MAALDQVMLSIELALIPSHRSGKSFGNDLCSQWLPFYPQTHCKHGLLGSESLIHLASYNSAYADGQGCIQRFPWLHTDRPAQFVH